jgi:ADP-heptose:LPS heptosyltransferase
VRLSHLGDVVHALPVFHALRERFPEAELAWAIQPEFAGLVQALPGLSRVIPFDRRGGLRAWRELRRELREFDADWALDAQGNLKSAAVTLASGARRRTGYHRRDWRERLGALVLTDQAPALTGRCHAIERSLHLARYATELEPAWEPSDWLGLSPEELVAGQERWSELLPHARQGAVILQLAAPGDVRAWPVERQRQLLQELAGRGTPTLALSGPGEGEAELGRELARALPDTSHWVGQRGLRALAAVLAAAARDGARFVGCDSGPLHLAVASGLRVVALAGPQDAALTGPWNAARAAEHHRALRAELLLPCAPCLSRSCSHEQGPLCMTELRVEQVLAALD